MDVAIKDGFYVDTTTNRTFYVRNKQIPVWVKSEPSRWKPLRKQGEKEIKINK